MIFKYKAYSDLLIELGRNDYIVEITTIAMRDLFSQMEQAIDPKIFIKEKCYKYGIMVSYDEKNNNQLILSQIATVYHLAETFFYDMQIEHNDFPDTNKFTFASGKTKLEQVITFIKDKNRINNADTINPHLIDTFEYYHELRVYFAHRKTVNIGDLKKKWEKAVKHFTPEVLAKYKVKNGPKILTELDFEDYFLFTQITKELALRLSSLFYPEPQNIVRDPRFVTLRKHKDNIARVLKGVENILSTDYGWIKENDSDTYSEDICKFV